LRAWLDQFWGDALQSFKDFVENTEDQIHESKGPGRRRSGRAGAQTGARARRRRARV
jgi:hypothetical protein